MRPMNWIQWLTLALALTIAWTVPIMFLRLEHFGQRIQQDRRDSIISSCIDQNHRHDATIKQLNAEGAAAIRKDPAQAAQIRHTVSQFELIFDASTPRRDCQKLAARYVNH